MDTSQIRLRRLRFRVASLCFLLSLINYTIAQNWQLASAPIATNWSAIAASADGSKIVALANGSVRNAAVAAGIYTSTDFGVTWTAQTNGPIAKWSSVAASADGTTLVAVADGPAAYSRSATIYTSTNSGATWIEVTNAPTGCAWGRVATSADGTKLVAAAYTVDYGFHHYVGGPIVFSTNSGGTWQYSVPSSLSFYGWESVACSADGTKVAAAALVDINSYGVPIHVSTNSGATWLPTSSPPHLWACIACSVDGTILVAGVAYDYRTGQGSALYMSTNSGGTWAITGSPSRQWNSVLSSTDGNRFVALDIDGVMYVSTDSGETWTTNTAPCGQWRSVVASADGAKLVALSSCGGIYISQGTISAPTLTYMLSGDTLSLSWPTNATGFTVQQNSDLAASHWVSLTNMPTVTNGQNRLNMMITHLQGFYRLLGRE